MRTMALVITLLIATSVFAQNPRSFVATTGNDANACTPGAECRTFTRALAVTNPGGEVIAITSGGYGIFAISQGATVTAAPGVYAATNVPAFGTGVQITAGVSERVVLRGLNFVMFGNSSFGIAATSFGTLSIEGCTITGGTLGSYGVSIAREAANHAAITDTVVRSGYAGFKIASRATLLRCRAENNSNVGLLVEDGTLADGSVTAVDFTSVANETGVLAVCSQTGHAVDLTLQRATVADNVAGVTSQGDNNGTATVRINESVIVHDTNYGVTVAGTASVLSSGNNVIAANTPTDVFGSLTSLTLQ